MQAKICFRLTLLLALLLASPVRSFAQDQVYTVYIPVIAHEGMDNDAVTAAAPSSTQPHPFQGDRQVRVMTRNLYFGADLTPVITAQTPTAFVIAVTQAYLAAQATDFTGRMQAIAAEIAGAAPLFVGLQEAAIWRTGALGNPAPATTVVADFVQLVLDHLDNQYEVLAVKSGFDAEAPTGAGVDVRLTIQDVLLVRSDVKRADLKLSNVQTGSYTTIAGFPSPLDPTTALTFPRQWIAVDAKIRGKRFRLITTHLESIDVQIRVAQAQELLNGPANTTLPTILIGDLNAEPGVGGDAAATLMAAGFTDLWPLAHPAEPGFSCCQAADLRNTVAQLDERIDLILVRNGPSVVDAQRVGDQPLGLPSGVQWPSDHAGVVATIQLP